MQRDLAGELLEVVVAGDEVGLAVDLDQHADLAVGVDVARTTPSAAPRSPRLAAFAWPFTRRISTALSTSPSASSSAALQSIIPAPVRSRSAFTSLAEIARAHLSVSSVGVEGAALAVAAGARRAGLGAGCRCGGRARARPGSRPPRPRGRAPAPRPRGAPAPRPRAGPAPRPRVRAFSSASRRASSSSARKLAGALGHHVADRLDDQLARADRVVVARDHVVDRVRVAVGVDQPDHRDLQPLGLAHADLLGLEVDDEHRVGQALHVAHAAEVGLELLALGSSRACARASAAARACRPRSSRVRSCRRLIRLEIVWKLVSRPPSQRWLT